MQIRFSFTSANFISNKQEKTGKSQTNPINNINPTITNKQNKVSCELLKAYNNVVSFKGEEIVKPELRSRYQESFNQFKDPNKWNHFIKTLCKNYAEEEIVLILDAVKAKNDEDRKSCTGFFRLININNKKNKDGTIPYDKNSSLERALTPFEAKELIVNELTKSSDIEKYFKLVDEENAEPKFAISVIKYNIEGENKHKLEALSQKLFNDNRQLSQDEAIACLTYGFGFNEQGQIQESHIKSFIDKLDNEYLDEDGNNNKLNLFEAALCITHDLNEDDIKRFFKIKSKEIEYKKEDGSNAEYTLQTQEAILCAKADLTDEELKRYAELKNKPIKYEAVRQHGNDTKTPSTELIISYIKNKYTDEQITELAKLGLKNESQFKDFKEILAILKSMPNCEFYNLENIAANLATLQDENGKNIFRKENDEFDFNNLDIASLEIITKFKLTLAQFEDYKEILFILKSMSNNENYSLEYIAGILAKVQDENGKNIFRNDKNEFNINLDIDTLKVIEQNQLTFAQAKDYIEIFFNLIPITKDKNLRINLTKIELKNINTFSDKIRYILYRLKSPNLKYQLELTRYIAFALAKRQNKNNKNIFRNSENRIDFTGLDIDSLYALLSFGLSLNEARDYREILSILKSMPNNENYPIEATSVHLAKLQDKNGKNIFRDDENKINFDELDISFLARFAIEIAPCSIYYSKINLQDYKEILSTLMSMQNYQHYYIERIAFFLSLLQDENSKNFFRDKNGQLDFNNLDIASLEIIAKFNLTPTQYDDYIEILSILSSMSNKEDYHTKNIAAGLAKLQDENGKNIFKNKNGEFDFHNLDFYSLEEISHQKLTQKQCQNYRYLATTMGIKPEYAVHIAKNEYLMQRFELIDPDIFWKGATGEAKSLFELMEHCLKIGELNGEKISSSDFDSNILENGNEFNDGTLTYSTEDESKNYSVELEKISHNNTPVLIVKNKSGQRESYIAYDGAIALVRPLSYLENDKLDNLKQSLSSHAHFSIEEINALTKSAIHFIVDIIEENGECIISKGIDGIEHAKPFDGKKLNTVETKNKFDNVLKKLHKDKNIKVEDIFRLMPKDAVIQIRPYATSSSSHPILYSLSAEWKDSNGTAWELRAHSDDLNHPNDEHNWVYRLGYKEENQEPRFYCVEKDADGNFIDSKFVVEDRNVDEDIMYKTHVQFDMEPEKFKENLISNPYFQSTIRNISISHNKTQEIQKIATELKVVREGEKVEETKNRIIQKCQQNAGYYLKYKKVVDCLLNEKGLPPLSRAG